VYDPVQREWLSLVMAGSAGQVRGNKGVGSETGSGGAMLERWKRESMRDEPYNNIGGVAKTEKVSGSGSGKEPNRRVIADSCLGTTGGSRWSRCESPKGF